MKKPTQYFFNIFILGYILFSFFTLTNCLKNSHNDGQSYSQLQQQNKETVQQLINEYRANTLDCKKINSILNQKVVIDSTIIGVLERRDGYYLKALINNSCEQKIYAILKCSSKIPDHYRSLKSNRAYIVASINKVDNIKTIAEADSLDGRSNFINGNNSILLTENCLALAETPIYSSLY
ncbi:MAG: hypothetical protein WC879_12535 [Melioribacteraceae bacterium]